MVKSGSPFPKEVYERNAQIYKLLANPKRLEILNIVRNREATVDELSEIIGIKKANTSQHLSILRYLNMVTVRRSGKNAFYKISDPRIVEPCKILNEMWAKKKIRI